MLVNKENFPHVVDIFSDPTLENIAFDTETTGLRPYHGDRLFSLILATYANTYYLNFHDYGDDTPVLDIDDCRAGLKKIFGSPYATYIAHNIKFDLAMLANEGIEVAGDLHDTMVIERTLDSSLNGKGVFSLAGTATRYGYTKDDAVDEYIKSSGLSEKVSEPWRHEEVEHRFYYKVPPEIIIPYGETDARVTHDIKSDQMCRASEMAATLPNSPSLLGLIHQENRLSRTVFEMERRGIRVDYDYCLKAYDYDLSMHESAIACFENSTGIKYEPTQEVLNQVFRDEPVVMTTGTKPTRSFEKWVLEDYSHPMAKVVLDIRKHKKKMDTFAGFLYNINDEGIVHTQLNQHIPWTGRFSSSNPNLQNMEKNQGDELDPWPIRRAIIPRDGMMFYMIDYDQMEYRVMLDMAHQMDLIELVKAGHDVHTATAKAVSIDRFLAKTANFAILYGAGIRTLAKQTGLTNRQAQSLRDNMMDALPAVEAFISRVKRAARDRGYIFNWRGRRHYFPDKQKAYKAVNSLVQGSCADAVKLAMIDCERYLAFSTCKMLLCIHDELVFEAPINYGADSIDDLSEIMCAAYPHKHLPLTVSVDHSYTSLAEKKKGLPGENIAGRNQIQAEGTQ